ncbi:MAG: glycine cleavage system protein R [Actinomycetota bacterium]
MHQVGITAIGRDHPGIVCCVSKVLYDQGCNLADCSMTILGGQFAMIMLVEAPDSLDAQQLQMALEPAAKQAGLSIYVQKASGKPSSAPARPYVISLYGADHPGIVYRFASQLAQSRINITDLVSRINRDHLYMVVLDVDLPADIDAQELEKQLEVTASSAGVDLSFRQAETDSL